MPHVCKREEKHAVAVIYKGKRSALAALRAECKNGRPPKLAKDETVHRTITIDTTQKPEGVRADVWYLLSDKENYKELPVMVFNLRAYKIICEHLGVFERDNDWVPYQHVAFNVAPTAAYDLLVKTVTDAMGDGAGKAQAYAFSPEGRAAIRDRKPKQPAKPIVEPKLVEQKPLKLPPATKPASATEIAKKTMVLVLTFSGIGNRRKVATSEIEVKAADKAWLAVSKKLIDAEELEAIASLDGEARRYIESRALPSQIKKGVYLVPTQYVAEFNERLTDYQAKRRVLAVKLCAAYSRLMKEAKERLKDLFNPADYPSPDTLRDAFQLTWRYIEVNTPASLEQINRMVWKKEQEKAERTWREAGEAAQALLRAEMAERVTKMIERLTPDASGKQKQIRDGSVEKVQEWLDSFAPRNINNDSQMQVLVERAKSLIAGISPEVLRQSEKARDYVRDGFKEIDKLLVPMVVTKPRRSISFDEV